MENSFNDDLTLDPKKESLLNSFLYWGMALTAKEGEGELKFKSMAVSVEPPNDIIESSLVNFVLASVDLSDEDEDVDKEQLESELLDEASNNFPVPVDSLSETAHQTAQKLKNGDDLFKELEFIPFKSKDQLFSWATDSQANAEQIYNQAEKELASDGSPED